jgi:hypothetical protein
MNDFFGQPLNIGDEVAFMTPRYRCMVIGKIVSFSPQTMLIEWNNTVNYGPQGRIQTFRATPDQVIKKPC